MVDDVADRALGCFWGLIKGVGVTVVALIVVGIIGVVFFDDDKPSSETSGEEVSKAAERKGVSGKLKPQPAGGRKTLEDRVYTRDDPPPGVRFSPGRTNAMSVAEAVAQLDDLIGLKPVKEEVKKFAAFVEVAQKRKAAGLKVPDISYHMVFTGNPGTGKTTVARIMADIYRALGVVKEGHLVETDRGGLVAGYTGQTAIKTGKVIDFALDGVLFIDEAYALNEGSQDSFGQEAIATLLKRMEDDRERLVVIVAGYSHEMKRFIDANSGIASRFNHYIEFPDYSAKELAAMFRQRARKSQYVLSADTEHWLDGAIALWTKDRGSKFGNGRWVRNLFEKTVERQAMRVAALKEPTTNDLMCITLHDVGIRLKDENASKED